MSNTQQRFVRPAEACRILGISRSTLWRLQEEGRIPRAVKIGERARAIWLPDLLKKLGVDNASENDGAA